MGRIRRPSTVLAVVLGIVIGATWLAPAERPPSPAVPVVEVDVRPASSAPIVPTAAALPRSHVHEDVEVEREATAAVSRKASAGRVRVEVVDEDGSSVDDAWVVPVDCPGFVDVGAGEYAVELGPCVLVARRLDGALIARSIPAAVIVREGETASVALELPSRRVGGIGIRFQPEPDGMRVVEVVPGTPAEAAGLLPGDMILAVGDDPVAGMDTEQFVANMTGDEGTDVEFTVRNLADTGAPEQKVRVTRAYLDG